MNQEKIGNFIATKRKEQGFTQEQLAGKLGVSINAVSKWERGICLIDMSLLKPLSEILKVDVIDVLSGEKVNTKDKDKEYENLILNLFGSMRINKRKIKIQYYLFEFIILLLTIMIVVLSNQEIITILAIILMVVASTFNMVFYILAKDVNYLLNNVKK